MNNNFSFDNVEQMIKSFQKKGWKVTEIGDQRFEFQFSDAGYSRTYDHLDDLLPLEIFAEEAPEIDVKAEYFSRLYQTYWANKNQRKIIR
jgi:hypothetical protein